MRDSEIRQCRAGNRRPAVPDAGWQVDLVAGTPATVAAPRARNLLSSVEVRSQSMKPGQAQIVFDAYAMDTVQIENCTFYPDREQGSAVAWWRGHLHAASRDRCLDHDRAHRPAHGGAVASRRYRLLRSYRTMTAVKPDRRSALVFQLQRLRSQGGQSSLRHGDQQAGGGEAPNGPLGCSEFATS